MSRIPFDQLAKQYLQSCLEPLGTVQRNLEVPGEAKFIDIWFIPQPHPPASSLDFGLLSQIATTPCSLEPFRNAPTRQEVKVCLLKLLWMQEELRRQLKQQQVIREQDLPKLWILAATVSQPVVREFEGPPTSDPVPGIYRLSMGLHSAIIALDQLPLTPETLWLRILGKGQTQQQAVTELLALPPDDLRRSEVLQLLVNWRVTVELSELSELIDREDQEVMATLSQAYLEWEHKTRTEGIEQGIEQGERSLLLKLLTRRVGTLPADLQARVERLSVPQLEALSETLFDLSTLADLESWLGENH
jgi:hypothetical protein